MSDSTDWLEPRVISCPSCTVKSYAVERSPFYNAWHLYCDQCAASVEVSYYNAHVKELRSQVPENDSQALLNLIEKGLASCDCGGKFKFNSPRRCFQCQTVLVDEPNIDVSIYTGCEDENREPEKEEQKLFDEYEKNFVRRSDLWLD